jgi:hypothetical protein
MAILTISSEKLTIAVGYFDIPNTIVVPSNATHIYSVGVIPEALALITH